MYQPKSFRAGNLMSICMNKIWMRANEIEIWGHFLGNTKLACKT